MASNLTPHWGVIVFLVAVYGLSVLLHLDPNVVNAGGGTAEGMVVTMPDIVVLLGELALGLTVGVLAGSFFGKWLGLTTGLCVIFLATVFLNTWVIMTSLFNIATFGGLGLPDVVQWCIAIPCILLLTWTVLAFLMAGTETFNQVARP
jgi:hypothetical protein